MAVFLVNVCKFNGCGLTYPSLGDLIQHIEETHIDYDPFSQEQQERQQPSCIPLSSALRFYTNLPSRKPATNSVKTATTGGTGTHATPASHHGQQTVGSGKGTPATNGHPTLGRASSTGSASPSVASEEPEYDIMTDSEDSNDSWTTQEEFSAEFIMRYGSKMSNPNANEEKPYSCPVPGCKKRYKNVNGIKYHAKNGHKKDAKIRKAFKCHCGKSYKTGQGLKNHAVINHAGTPLTTITTSMGEVLQIPTSQVTTLQPVRVSLSALMAGHGVPVKSVTARHLLATSFKDSLRRIGSDPSGRDDGHTIALTGVSRANTIQVAVPASGIIPLSGDKELTAVPVSRLLAQGLGGSIKLAQLGTAAGHHRISTVSAVSAADTATTTTAVVKTVVRKAAGWDSGTAAGATAVSVSCGGDVSRPVTPPGQQLRAALPPTPLTPGWQGAPFPDSQIDEEDDLPPTPASLLDGAAGEPLAGPA